MREAIERVIADYESRMNSMQTILDTSTSDEQRKSVLGKYHVLNGVIHDLKGVIASEPNNQDRGNTAEPEHNA